MVKNLAEPRNILAEPLGSAEPRLKNTALGPSLYSNVWFEVDSDLLSNCILITLYHILIHLKLRQRYTN